MTLTRPHPINRRVRMAQGLDVQVDSQGESPQQFTDASSIRVGIGPDRVRLSQIEKFYMRYTVRWYEKFYGGRNERT